MKPKIDQNECIGDGICSDICPEVFELRDDGVSYVINEEAGDELADKIQEAISECPTAAISVED